MKLIQIKRHDINIACYCLLLWLLDEFLCGYRIQKVPKFSITLKHVWKITEKLSAKNHDCEKDHLAKKILKPEKDTLKFHYYIKNKGKRQFNKQIYDDYPYLVSKKISVSTLTENGVYREHWFSKYLHTYSHFKQIFYTFILSIILQLPNQKTPLQNRKRKLQNCLLPPKKEKLGTHYFVTYPYNL